MVKIERYAAKGVWEGRRDATVDGPIVKRRYRGSHRSEHLWHLYYEQR